MQSFLRTGGAARFRSAGNLGGMKHSSDKTMGRAGGERRIAVNLPAEVLIIDDGVAHNLAARIVGISAGAAEVEVYGPLAVGQRVGLVIRGLEQDIFQLFSADGAATPRAVIRTQGEVTSCERGSAASAACRAEVRFQGNIRISADNG
jgi:hypothetical protein